MFHGFCNNPAIKDSEVPLEECEEISGNDEEFPIEYLLIVIFLSYIKSSKHFAIVFLQITDCIV